MRKFSSGLQRSVRPWPGSRQRCARWTRRNGRLWVGFFRLSAADAVAQPAARHVADRAARASRCLSRPLDAQSNASAEEPSKATLLLLHPLSRRPKRHHRFSLTLHCVEALQPTSLHLIRAPLLAIVCLGCCVNSSVVERALRVSSGVAALVQARRIVSRKGRDIEVVQWLGRGESVGMMVEMERACMHHARRWHRSFVLLSRPTARSLLAPSLPRPAQTNTLRSTASFPHSGSPHLLCPLRRVSKAQPQAEAPKKSNTATEFPRAAASRDPTPLTPPSTASPQPSLRPTSHKRQT